VYGKNNHGGYGDKSGRAMTFHFLIPVVVTVHAIVNRSKTHQIEKWQAEKWNLLFSACHFSV
jgi:hypothetical protein